MRSSQRGEPWGRGCRGDVLLRFYAQDGRGWILGDRAVKFQAWTVPTVTRGSEVYPPISLITACLEGVQTPFIRSRTFMEVSYSHPPLQRFPRVALERKRTRNVWGTVPWPLLRLRLPPTCFQYLIKIQGGRTLDRADVLWVSLWGYQ